MSLLKGLVIIYVESVCYRSGQGDGPENGERRRRRRALTADNGRREVDA